MPAPFPIAQDIAKRFADLDRQHDIGELKIKISGCINACGHHHAGHIGILGVDKKGVEFYQLLLGGSGAEDASIGEIMGPGFGDHEIADAVERVVDVYLKRAQGRANASSTPIAASAWSRSRTSPIRNRCDAAYNELAAFAQDAFASVADDAALPEGGGAGVAGALSEGPRRAARPQRAARRAAADPSENRRSAGRRCAPLSPGGAGISQIPRRPRLFLGAACCAPGCGFTGEIRAVGDFLYDQIAYQRRVGFDAWEVPDGFTPEMFNRALTEMTNVYQPSADGRKTIRELRGRLSSLCGNRRHARANLNAA